jgi:hypothetical protein
LATNIASCVEDPKCTNYVADATEQVTNNLTAGFNNVAQYGLAVGSAVLTDILGLAADCDSN